MTADNSQNDNPLRREKAYLAAFFWTFVFFLIFANLLLKATSDYWAKAQDYTISKDEEFLTQFAQAKNREDVSASLVMIGTSRMRNATPLGLEPAEPLVLPDGEKIAALQFSVDAASFSSFAHLTNRILQETPDVLMIERSLLSNDSRGGAGQTTSTHWALNAIYEYINRKLLHDVSFEETWRHYHYEFERDCLQDFSRAELASLIDATLDRDVHNISGKEPDAFREFIGQALARNIRVVILDVPPYLEKLNVYGVERYRLDTATLDQYPQEQVLLPQHFEGVQWLYYSSPQQDNIYCDFTHYNDQGRRYFKDWMDRELMRIVNKT